MTWAVRSSGLLLIGAGALLAGCGESPAESCARCPTAVVAAVGEPPSIFPPLVQETVGRDIGDLVYRRLADLAPGRPPIDSSAYRPSLASRWERVDSLTWRFHLQPGVRWQDGEPVTSADVVFSFAAYADSTLDTPARGAVAPLRVEAPDPSTVLIRFPDPGPEQLYDATYHVRIVPRHIWSRIPQDRWAADTDMAHLVGTGPYHVVAWRRGESLRLAADTVGGTPPAIRQLVWRFTESPDAALNLVLSHEADLLETVGGAEPAGRIARDSLYRLESYPSAVYGFLAFRVADRRGRPTPVLGQRAVRRALAMATDRSVIAPALFGPDTRVPAGPGSRLLWILGDSVEQLPYDTAAAAAELDRAGWRRGGDGFRRRGGTPLAFDILVPSTSATRRRAAEVLQQAWRRLGVRITVTAVDFPVFQERLGAGRFDSYIGAYLDEPSPRGLAAQWTRRGWDELNFGHYADPVFDSLLQTAAQSARLDQAAALYRAALDTLNGDAPAIFLYTLTNTAAIQRRFRNVTIDPYAWLGTLPSWTIDPSRGIPADSL